MAEPLIHQFGPEIPTKIATQIFAVYPNFMIEPFMQDALNGYENLSLLQRGKHIATALQKHLPKDYKQAITILLQSIGPALETTDSFGMQPFLYLPHIYYVSIYGLEHFEESMHAQYELTQRFSAEFSIRAFLERYPTQTLKRLHIWAKDPNPHVRRLVSEGTRPRLPWASRLIQFQNDPTPTLELLELLKDDPSLYVRRSVANHLNDIGKDHPKLLTETAQKWLVNATEERRWLVQHALRSAVKKTNTDAISALGFTSKADVSLAHTKITPKAPRIGDKLEISFTLTNKRKFAQSLLVDLRIHFVKANGKTSPKVFKLKSLTLKPKETTIYRKSISLADMTTRKHYPGTHLIELLINGESQPLGTFQVS